MSIHQIKTALLLSVSFAVPAASSARGEQTSGEQDRRVEAAAEYLRSLAEGMRVTVTDGEENARRVRDVPLMKYNDPARGYLAAGVWRVGESGRPKALISLEYWVRNPDAPDDQPVLSYEILSIGKQPAELTSMVDGMTWRLDGTGVNFATVPDSAAPAPTPRQRLAQMRSLLRRFAISENYRGDISALRLLSQPIDRYDDPQAGILDGAAFIFAYGTNPEAVVFIECTKQEWRYAVVRMSWAESAVQLDGRVVLKFPELKEHPAGGSYLTGQRPVTGTAVRRDGLN